MAFKYGPFSHQTTFDHLNTALVWYSVPHYIKILQFISALSESASETPKHDLSSATLNNDEDILNVDCREEVDEFSKFLNDFETELNDAPPAANVKGVTSSKPGVDGEKKKKTKIVKRKKLVKRVVKKRRGGGEKSSTTGTSDKLDTTQASSAPGIDSRRSSE